MAVLVAGNRIKAFKKRDKGEPNLESMDSDDDLSGANDDPKDEG